MGYWYRVITGLAIMEGWRGIRGFGQWSVRYYNDIACTGGYRQESTA